MHTRQQTGERESDQVLTPAACLATFLAYAFLAFSKSFSLGPLDSPNKRTCKPYLGTQQHTQTQTQAGTHPCHFLNLHFFTAQSLLCLPSFLSLPRF